jgi:hypothetical protein
MAPSRTALGVTLVVLACATFARGAPALPPAATPATRPAQRPEPVETRTRALLAEWKERFDAERFNYTVAGPFLIAGDGSNARIARYRDGTVLAAERALRATYFDKQPAEPVLVLLFERAGPYKRLAKKWFGDDNVPHFGFFRRSDGVMLMNVGTGTGTLVHELVHALMAPDFPDVPDWFNEGLASLYEQCSLDGDTIKGHENWRLPGLQAAIQQDKLRPLAEMIQDPRFYDEAHVGINYAQSRYLMMYLQEKGRLTDFYKRFRDGAKDDPNGLATLKRVLKTDDLTDFEASWRQWVLGLKFN